MTTNLLTYLRNLQKQLLRMVCLFQICHLWMLNGGLRQMKNIFQPKGRKPPLVLKIINEKWMKFLKNGQRKLSHKSYCNIHQVRVSRFDNSGIPAPGRDGDCLDLSCVNPSFELFENPIPDIQEMITDLSEFCYFSELDLFESYNQLVITETSLGNILTFNYSFWESVHDSHAIRC